MTDREKYILELSSYLSPLNIDERNDALEFYGEYILDANLASKAEIERRLGTPRQLSYKILADYSIRTNNDETAQSGHLASPKSNWRVFWWVLIAIITAPITIGFGAAAIGVLIGLAGAAIGVLIAAIGIIVSIIGVAAVCLYVGVILLFSNPLTSIFYFGLGLILIGVFLIVFPLLAWFGQLLGQGIANFAKYIYGKLQIRRER